MYNFSNNGSETEDSDIKIRTLAREHVSTQGTLALKHVSTQGTLAHEHVSAQGTLAQIIIIIIIVVHLFRFGFTRIVHKIINYNMAN